MFGVPSGALPPQSCRTKVILVQEKKGTRKRKKEGTYSISEGVCFSNLILMLAQCYLNACYFLVSASENKLAGLRMLSRYLMGNYA